MEIIKRNKIFFGLLRNNVKKIIFVPYADVDKDYDGYTKKFADVFAEWG